MININGRTYSGNNIQISNNRVIIDGKDVTGDHKDEKVINISVEGNIESLDVGYCQKISVKGDCGRVKSASGDVKITGNVTGDVSAQSGEIEIGGNVGGSVSTQTGDVKCGTVSGSVKTTTGDIRHK